MTFFVTDETLTDLIKEVEEPTLNGSAYCINVAQAQFASDFESYMMYPSGANHAALADMKMFKLTIPVEVERSTTGFTDCPYPGFTVVSRTRLKRPQPFINYPHRFDMKRIDSQDNDATRLAPRMEQWLHDNCVGRWSWNGLFTFAFEEEQDCVLMKLRWS